VARRHDDEALEPYAGQAMLAIAYTGIECEDDEGGW